MSVGGKRFLLALMFGVVLVMGAVVAVSFVLGRSRVLNTGLLLFDFTCFALLLLDYRRSSRKGA